MKPAERIVFIDLETGGLDPLRHPIIQFAGIAVDGDWNEMESLEMKIQFDSVKADQNALVINGYDPDVWAREGVSVNAARDRVVG